MSYFILRNGTPRSIHFGTDDQSLTELVPTPVETPIHLPIMYGFFSRGDENNSYMVLGDSLFSMYGRDALELDSAYTTFNTPYMALFNNLANAMYVQRLRPDDAETATARLYVEVVAAKVPVYERDEFGGLVLDSQGKPVQTGTKDGHLFIWHVIEFPKVEGVVQGVKQGTVYQGTRVGSDGKKSMLYPILDLAAGSFGKFGSNTGFRLSCPNAKSGNGVNSDMVNDVGARVYTIQFVERTEAGASPSILRDLDGATNVSFCFKPGAYYRDMKLTLDYQRVVLPAYRKMNPANGLPPTLGPVSDFYVYQDHLETVLAIAAADVGETDIYKVDIFTGVDMDGNPYNGLVVDSGANGGAVFTEANTHYLQGGSDGTMGNEQYDKLVRRELANFGNGTVTWKDMSRYPVTAFWDSGFSTETKAEMAQLTKLPNLHVESALHVFGSKAYDMQTENAMRNYVSSIIRSIPESERYGTPSVRASITGHSMLLNDVSYYERVPGNYPLARMVAQYMGAGEGKFKAANRFNRGELTIIDDGYDINLTYKEDDTYDADWKAGMNNIRNFDQYRQHFPAVRGCYPYDRSILTGFIPSFIVAHLNIVAHRVWNEVSGAQGYTDAELVQMVNEKITAKTSGRYDGIVDITPEAYFTAEDKANGFSIHIKIHMTGDVMDTVGQFTIVAHRRSEA